MTKRAWCRGAVNSVIFVRNDLAKKSIVAKPSMENHFLMTKIILKQLQKML